MHGLVIRLGKIRLPGRGTAPPAHGHPDLTLKHSPRATLPQLCAPELSAADARVWPNQARGSRTWDLHKVGQHLSTPAATTLFIHATQTIAIPRRCLLQTVGTIPRSPSRITLLPITCMRPLQMQAAGETVHATAHSHKCNASFENVRACQVHGLVMRLGKIRLPECRTVPPGHAHPDLALRYSPGAALGPLGSPELSAAAHSGWTHQVRGY